ncbi:MAG TPA: efflux RND transporter periplasmic adaptor subunit [Polyangia bacterium]|nr:efflux RND transporter periplasmic adaptor subunit [Polyangia bacterium]
MVAASDPAPGRGPFRRDLVVVAGATVALLIIGAGLVHRAHGRVNRVALAASPRPVTVIEARATTYADSRDYVGAVESWIEASVGPQYISAYVSTVLVRPGDAVRRNQVLATLDCAHPTAQSRAMEMQARAIDERQRALADEAVRERSMLGGGFIAPNQVEQSSAQSSSEKARLLETRARAQAASLEVRDCALKAPFDGDVATRSVDPGAFVHPGAAIVSVVDRRTVRVVVDAPETDFGLVRAGAPLEVEMLATGAPVEAAISRRAPKADPATRTIRFEVDIADPGRQFPTATTALVHLGVGRPAAATEIPLDAAIQQAGKAKVFEVDGNRARLVALAVLGERGGSLFFAPGILAAGTRIVTDGRALLSDGDLIEPHVQTEEPAVAPDAGTRGGGFGRPP